MDTLAWSSAKMLVARQLLGWNVGLDCHEHHLSAHAEQTPVPPDMLNVDKGSSLCSKGSRVLRLTGRVRFNKNAQELVRVHRGASRIFGFDGAGWSRSLPPRAPTFCGYRTKTKNRYAFTTTCYFGFAKFPGNL